MKSKAQVHTARKISEVDERSPVCNHNIIIDSGAFGHIVSALNLFTSFKQIESTGIKLANSMVVESPGKGSMTVCTGSDRLHSVRFIIYRLQKSISFPVVDVMKSVLPRALRRVFAVCITGRIIMNYS